MRHFLTVLVLLALAACTPFKQRPADSQRKGYSPLLYAYGESIPAQWEGKDWDPAAWPISYQNKKKFTQNLFDADIIRDQYIKKGYMNVRDTYSNVEYTENGGRVPVVEVGPNFYRLSDHDQYRVCDTLNQLYGATTGKYGGYVLTDWYSGKIIGEYSKSGLTLR